METQTKSHGGDLLETTDLQGLFRVTAKTISVWRAAGMPCVEEGGQGRGHKATFRLQEVVEWYFAENYERLELDRQRTRLASEQADEKALENAVTRGDLLEKGRIGDGIERAFVAFRERLRGLATKLAPRVNPEKPNLARDIIAAEHDAVLNALADHFSGPARSKLDGDDGGAGPGLTAPSKANGKRVGRSVSAAKPRNKRRAGAVGH